MVRIFSRASDKNRRLAPNFLAGEFMTNCTLSCCINDDEILIDERLPRVLQRIRELCGNKKVRVTSGYRNRAHNTRIGGATNSFHMQGMAADIIIAGVNLELICSAAETALHEAGISGGIILYTVRRFVHVDLRPARYRGIDNGTLRNVPGWERLPVTPPTVATPPTMDGQSNVQTVWNFFIRKGLSRAAVAAIIGNLQQESSPNIDPALIERPSGQGHGIAQWSFDRRTRLFNTAKEQGTAWQDLDFQLNFMWFEMTTRDIDDRMKGRATNWNDNGAFANTLNRAGAVALPGGFQDFIRMTDVRAATILFEATFFRAGVPRIERRIQFAEAALLNIAAAPTTPTPTPQSTVPYNVRVTASTLFIRTGAGRTYRESGNITDRGIYTIFKERRAADGVMWGAVKVGEGEAQTGWISLEHTQKI